MKRIMPCMGAHPISREEVVTMDDVDVDVARLSAAPTKRKERMSTK
jgi:hypothetical protein